MESYSEWSWTAWIFHSVYGKVTSSLPFTVSRIGVVMYLCLIGGASRMICKHAKASLSYRMTGIKWGKEVLPCVYMRQVRYLLCTAIPSLLRHKITSSTATIKRMPQEDISTLLPRWYSLDNIQNTTDNLFRQAVYIYRIVEASM